MNIPKYLYKYRAFSKNHIGALVENNAWFAIGETFNDPFDCTPEIPMITGDYSSITKWAEKACPQQVEHLTALYGSRKAALDQIFKITANSAMGSDNPVKVTIDAVFNRLVRSFVCCFSTSSNNNLLWSHYGDYHKGFCIRYDAKKLLESNNIEFHGEVNYCNEPINITDFLISNDMLESSRAFVLQKQPEWLYEEEYRVVYQDFAKDINDKYRQLNHADDCVDMILFGLKAERENKKLLMSLLDKRKIKFKEMKRGRDNYKLFVEP